VSLALLTFLVGPNGVGKSNFVEALRFLSFGLSASLEQAIETRSGFTSILNRAAADPIVHLEVQFSLPGIEGRYAVEIAASPDAPVTVHREECSMRSADGAAWFKVENGAVTSNQGITPAASLEKLYLVNASGLAAFEPAYRALSNIIVYNPVPDEIRGNKPEKRYRHLDRSASVLAETIHKMKSAEPRRWDRIVEYLRKVYPNIVDVTPTQGAANFSLSLILKRTDGHELLFPSENISDGTLRALAVLVALFQRNDRYPLTLAGLEEPEAGLHPAAAEVLFDALVEASLSTQVVVTSHSPDLLDRDDISLDSLKSVAMVDGSTIIGPIDTIGKKALKDRLYTVGELMRMDQLRPEASLRSSDAG
jgi:predicted ATPase